MLGHRCPLNAYLVSHLVSGRDLHLGRSIDLGFGSVLVIILSKLTWLVLSTVVEIILESYYGEIWNF